MVKVGLIQMEATPLKVEENLSRAGYNIDKAAMDGAELIVLPEVFNVGLSLEEDLMKLGESLEGPTVSWLKDQAAKHGIYILTSFYERYDDFFYNTMVMVGADKSVQFYRKRNPTIQERLVWKRSDDPGPGIFETPFGRIGGSICFDSFSTETYEGFKQSGVDLVIMIALWGSFAPMKKYPDTFIINRLMKYQSKLASEVVPRKYTEKLGVPAVFVNMCGTLNLHMIHPPLYPMPDWKKIDYCFIGNSNVFDASGQKLIDSKTVDAQGEFCSVVQVELQPAEKRQEVKRVSISPEYLKKRYYFVPPPFMFRLYQKLCFSGFEKRYEAMRCRNI